MDRACSRCGRPGAAIPVSRATATSVEPATEDENGRCVFCEKEQYLFDRVIPLWIYEDLVCDAVVAAKFGHQTPLADALGTRLGRRVSTLTDEDPPEMVVGIPQHWTRRLVRRGNGNQALVGAVARQLGKHSSQTHRPIALIAPMLRTTRKIQKQAWLDDAARRKNVLGAFAISKGYGFSKPERRIVGSHVLLVDDVLTTGATANEITGVLRAAGARKITLAVVARAFWN